MSAREITVNVTSGLVQCLLGGAAAGLGTSVLLVALVRLLG